MSSEEGRERIPAEILGGDSRLWRDGVGGKWDEIGRLQFEYLLSRGLRPDHRLLDIGCGCLRGGVHFAGYLDDGNYFGIDRNETLLEAGRTRELVEAGLSERTVTLSCRDDFVAANFGGTFDFALAQSVFTHLPWNSILRCLVEAERVLAPDGQFFATFFEDPDGSHRTTRITHSPGDITTHPDQEPYHYEFSTFVDLARRAGLEVDYLGDWDHPRAQKMMVFRPRRTGACLPISRPEPAAGDPVLSLVVVVYEMEREAPRTLHTLSPEYQGVSPALYEVIIVENGSAKPLGRDRVESISKNFRYIYLEPGNPSPVEALNLGAALSRGRLLGFMIDGARMLSPGVVHYALRAERAYCNPVVSTVGYHLGPDPHHVAVTKGYDQAQEDKLLENVDWQRNGYELFRTSTLSESGKYGMFALQAESNCLFVTTETYASVGGFHPDFDGPGGGLANLDFFREVIELPETEWVVLLGEGSFHQFHDGEMTGRPSEEVTKKLEELYEEYRTIRNRPFQRPLKACDFLGHAPASFRPVLKDALEQYASFQRFEVAQADLLEALPRPPNRPGQSADTGRAVLILGMHRSGTSMLAGTLQEAGLFLGNVVEQAPHNEKGNRENWAILHLQEDLLERNGGSWKDIPEVVEWHALHRAVRDHFIAGFAGEKIWGFKDPRTLFTIDGWLEVLPDAELVGIFRHPLPVAESLRSRDGMSIDQGLELWRIYNERLLDLHAKKPFPLIEFNEDSGRLREALRGLIMTLELPGRFRKPLFFEEALRHHHSCDQEAPEECLVILNELRRRQQRTRDLVSFGDENPKKYQGTARRDRPSEGLPQIGNGERRGGDGLQIKE